MNSRSWATGYLPAELRHHEILDCEWNRIVDVTITCELPSLTLLCAAYNSISSLRLNLGRRFHTLDILHIDITHLSLQSSLHSPKAPAKLNLSHAKLSSHDTMLGSLTSLFTHQPHMFTSIPESLCQLRHLAHQLNCADNKLTALPEGIGQLDSLKS